ncbi:hypothetical protein [Peptostreptococcus faecalis]|uniref:hypothetical protein n=1 Tax=Peptostreptococcus faecalis TaxID=2045015 RepID=UPI000C7DABA5|nr:hypothetical protein [Peptostreptococcus faecalis]
MIERFKDKNRVIQFVRSLIFAAVSLANVSDNWIEMSYTTKDIIRVISIIAMVGICCTEKSFGKISKAILILMLVLALLMHFNFI